MKGSTVCKGELAERTMFQCAGRTYLHWRIRCRRVPDTGPGQFIMLETGDDCYLDRPFSIMDAIGGILELLMEVKGKGTRHLLSMGVGDAVRFKGPYGKELTVFTDHPEERIDLIAGGMGIVPLHYLCWEAMREGRGKDVSLFFGADSRELFHALEKLLNFPGIFRGMRIYLIPLDESGMTVVEFYRGYMERSEIAPHHIVSCGPWDMQKAVQDMILEMDMTGHLLLERRMGCGRGMCMGCPVKILDDGHETTEMTCTDGPSFAVGRGRKVIF